MLSRLLGLGELGKVSHVAWYLRYPWPLVAVLALILGAIGVVAYLYRGERALSRTRRVILGSLRALLYAILIVMLFEPVFSIESTVRLRRSILVLLDGSESMATADPRRERRELEDAALALGLQSFAKPSFALSTETRAAAATATRLALAKSILDHPELGVFDRLRREYKLRYFRFGDKLEPIRADEEALAESLRAIQATDKTTRLGTAIEEAAASYGGQALAGIILLTDGAANGPLEPLDVARRLADRRQRIPIYPIGLGLPHQPDIRIQKLIVRDTVFAKDRVPMQVQIASAGYANREVELSVSVDGEVVERRRVVLTGTTQFEELSFVPEQTSGSIRLEVAVGSLPGEATDANNTAPRTVRVIDEKIKVLYIEGKPRWEYRYLRAVLLRDHRLDVKFIMTQGDRDLARASERHLAHFPEAAGEAFRFDLVIIGDVPASYFSRPQFERMEQLVRERGGSLLMLAGHRHAPVSYIGTPVEAILPVRVRNEGWERISDVAHPAITETGHEHAVTSLEADKGASERLWALVRPLYRVPALAGRKPAAEVLATLAGGPRRAEPYPLIAWQRYGSGKSLFVGTDQLWRLRFKRGDRFHARFWGQAIQFLTLSRLLGENKQIRLETDRKDYRTGERIQIYANVLDEAYEPVAAPAYAVVLEPLDRQGEAKAIRLRPVKGSQGFYQGFFAPTHDGHYRLRTAAADQEVSNTVQFHVRTIPREQLERSMQEELLKRLAKRSGGKYFGIRDLPSLPDAIAGEHKTTVKRTEKELWDLPIVFLLILGCAGTEWFLRRRYDLI